MVQDADAIWREEIDKAGIAHEIGDFQDLVRLIAVREDADVVFAF